MQEDRRRVDTVSRIIAVPPEDMIKGAESLVNENNVNKKKCEMLSGRINEAVANDVLSKAGECCGIKIIHYLAGPDEDPAMISISLTARPKVVVVIGWVDKTPKMLVSEISQSKVRLPSSAKGHHEACRRWRRREA